MSYYTEFDSDTEAAFAVKHPELAKGNPKCPEAIAWKACHKAEKLTAENAALKADLAKLKSELSASKLETTKAKSEAAKANAAAASAALPTGKVITKAQQGALYEQMEKLPEAEQRAFYVQHLQGRIAA